MEGPVLEEFIPIKKRASLDCDDEEEEYDDDEDEQHSYKTKISKDNNKKSDWLRSVQLWHPDPPTEEKMSVIEVKRSGSGGAFQPFHKEKKDGKTSESFSKAPSSTPVAAASSTVVTVTRDNSGSSKREEKDGQRKQRRCWSQELHKRFLQALQQRGGPDSDCHTKAN